MTDGFETEVAFDVTRLQATVAGANGGSCSVNNTTGVITALFQDGALNPLPAAATTYCNVTFTVAAGAATTLALNVRNTLQSNDGAPSGQPLTETDGTITVTTGPQSPLLTFNPNGGALTLNAAGSGTIGVTASADTGTATPLTCTATNATATVTGSPFAANSTGSVSVQCTPQVGVTQAVTVSCDPNQPQGTNQAPVNFTATCPAITPQPEFSANLAVSLVGAPGATVTGSAGITNTGNAPLTITCGTPSNAAFTVTSPPAASVPAGGSTSIGLSCVTPAAAGATVTGTLGCTTNDADEGAVVFNLSCTAQVLSVPTMGSFGKGIMIALLAGLGLLGFAMRRRAA